MAQNSEVRELGSIIQFFQATGDAGSLTSPIIRGLEPEGEKHVPATVLLAPSCLKWIYLTALIDSELISEQSEDLPNHPSSKQGANIARHLKRQLRTHRQFANGHHSQSADSKYSPVWST